jgi:hypothetical protein
MSFEATLARKIRQFTVWPSGEPREKRKETLILAQGGDSLEDAYRLARERLDAGDALRIIGPGVTLERVWPDWVRRPPAIALTEWGAFNATSQLDATQEIQEQLRAWIRETFGTRFGTVARDAVLFPAACQRFFQEVVVAYPFARALASAFPDATVVPVSCDGITARLLEQLLAKTGGRVERAPGKTRRSAAWRLELLGVGAAAAAASVMRALQSYRAAIPSLRAIRRSANDGAPAPRTWIGLVPDWYRINHHLLDAFALPETSDGGPLGVLLISSLAPNQRDEADPRLHHASELWPGLGELRARLPQCVVRQAVMPEGVVAVARSAAVGLARSTVALARLSRSRQIRLPSLDHEPNLRQLVAWATLDVMRATMAEAAARELVARVPMRGKTVIFIGTNDVGVAPVDLVLQRAGATTVDHPHGAGLDNWTAGSVTASSIRLLWTYPDAQSAAVPGTRTLVTGMPLRMNLPPRSEPARRVLIMSSYVHRDSARETGISGSSPCFPDRIFQTELLDLIRLLRARGHADLTFRWRPHPADSEPEVQRELATLRGVELSRGRPLEEDVTWADVVVSSNSTVVIEAMFGGVPVFVHATPALWDTPALSFVSRGRLFFHATAGAQLVSEWLRDHGDHPDAGLGPEDDARRVLFGASREPIPLTDYFGRSAKRPLVLATNVPSQHSTPTSSERARRITP